MFTREDIELLKEQLAQCYSNYIEMLVDETGLTRPTVSKFLNHKPIKPKNKTLIYKTGFNLIARKKEEEKSLIKDLKRMAKGEPFEGKQTTLELGHHSE